MRLEYEYPYTFTRDAISKYSNLHIGRFVTVNYIILVSIINYRSTMHILVSKQTIESHMIAYFKSGYK